MALEFKDSVKDQTTTTGTGTVTIVGTAPAGFRTITSAHTDASTVRYRISSADNSEWEVGQGVWTASGATLTRATVYASSNAGALVSFSAGTKSVITGLTAQDMMDKADLASVPGTGTANSWTAQQTFKELKETVYTITDGAAFEIDPVNGSVQTVTLGASRTPAATNFEAGQLVVLGIDDGTAYSVTWSTVNPTWTKIGGGGAAPTLAATGKTWIVLWKVGSTMYASHLGDG
jgi:hypothetical protein